MTKLMEHLLSAGQVLFQHPDGKADLDDDDDDDDDDDAAALIMTFIPCLC